MTESQAFVGGLTVIISALAAGGFAANDMIMPAKICAGVACLFALILLANALIFVVMG